MQPRCIMGTLWHQALRWGCAIGLFTRQGLQVVICIRHLHIGSVFFLLLLLLMLLLLLLLLILQQQVVLHVNG